MMAAPVSAPDVPLTVRLSFVMCDSTTPAEVDLWLAADAPKALELQRPVPDDALRIVASGEKEDGAHEGRLEATVRRG
jgi:putative SOS response-associated peptidase YedK